MTDEVPECFQGNGIEMSKDDFCFCAFCRLCKPPAPKKERDENPLEVKKVE